MNRKRLRGLITQKKEEIKKLEEEVNELANQDLLLSDNNQWYVETEEEVCVKNRPKVKEIRKIGRVYWKVEFKDYETGEPIELIRNQIVTVNGKFC